MKKNIYTILAFCLIHQFSIAQAISLEGTIWLDSDTNNQYDGEDGISDVKVYLINLESTQIIDSSFTDNADFSFPSSSSITIPAGTYYLEIAAEEFTIGGDLQNIASCPGANNAEDEVDLDDNGFDAIPIETSFFTLDSGLVEHVDFCLSAPCDGPNPLAATACNDIAEVDIICNISTLGTFCNILPTGDSPGNQPNPLCPGGGAPGNISWFAFVASNGNYSIVISPSACMGSTIGMEGIQVGLYTNCTFSECVFCSPECSEDPVTISSDVLEEGQTYYFFIDGCGGSVCSYAIDIEGNPIPPNLAVDELCILNEGTTICEDAEFTTGSEILFLEPNLDLNIDYTWQIITLSGTPYDGDPNPMTEESNIELIFNDEGIYSVCLEQIDGGCTFWSGSVCRTVTINNIVGLHELETSDIKITPNPAFDYVTLDIDISFSNATFIIYSIDRERVMAGNLDASQKVDISGLSSGLYLIGISDKDNEVVRTTRFVKNE